MGMLKAVDKEELGLFFKTNLRGLIKDRELKNYVANLMEEFVYKKKFMLFFDERGESVRFDDLFKKDKFYAYNSFKDIGDTYLWFCGFYPEHLLMKRKSMLRLKDYISYGKTSYNYAVYFGNFIKKVKQILELYQGFQIILLD